MWGRAPALTSSSVTMESWSGADRRVTFGDLSVTVGADADATQS